MEDIENKQCNIFFRVAIVGANRQRVAKVLSLILDRPPIQDHDDESEKRNIHIEYIPCVATFDSYKNENDESVKYLMKLEQHGKDGQSHGTSLTPFFDEVIDEKEENIVRMTGIAGFAVGCGIESDEDIQMISTFIKSVSGSEGDEKDLVVKCIKPNAEFSSMKEETVTYKNLSQEDKDCLSETQLMGPAKMAKFTMEMAKEFVPRSKKSLKAEGDTNTNDEVIEEEEFENLPPPMPEEFDPNKTKFACKMCRTILFSQAELEDPPHNQSQHTFSSRKTKSGGSINNSQGTHKCQSHFLADGLNWMGNINLSHEGKLSCPKCSSKLGLYKWHGTQCSCGTWVVPAIMVHKSRVDVVPPIDNHQTNYDPLVALMNPLARLHVGGQGY